MVLELKEYLIFFKAMFDEIEKKLTFTVKIVTMVIGLSLAFGFFIWNLYLYRLGFVEYNLIQTRFILTGLMFLFLSSFIFPISYIIRIIGGLFAKTKVVVKSIAFFRSLIISHPGLRFYYMISWSILLFLAWIVIYTLYIFPQVNSGFGGGEPRLISLLADKESLEYLTSLSLDVGDGAKYQTANYCIAYENSEFIIILLPDRVLQVKKDFLLGFGSIPPLSVIPGRKAEGQKCKDLGTLWTSAKIFHLF